MASDAASFDTLMSKGVAASRDDDSAVAIECFEKASAAAPEAALPQFLLGAEFAALGRYQEAEAAFANAARLAPTFYIARYQLGLLQFSSGRAAVGLLTWEPLLGLPDTDPLPHFVRGFAALAHDRFDDALRHYRQGLALNAKNPALSFDIEKLVAAIQALKRGAGEMSESDAHALLANYRHQGRAH